MTSNNNTDRSRAPSLDSRSPFPAASQGPCDPQTPLPRPQVKPDQHSTNWGNIQTAGGSMAYYPLSMSLSFSIPDMPEPMMGPRVQTLTKYEIPYKLVDIAKNPARLQPPVSGPLQRTQMSRLLALSRIPTGDASALHPLIMHMVIDVPDVPVSDTEPKIETRYSMAYRPGEMTKEVVQLHSQLQPLAQKPQPQSPQSKRSEAPDAQPLPTQDPGQQEMQMQNPQMPQDITIQSPQDEEMYMQDPHIPQNLPISALRYPESRTWGFQMPLNFSIESPLYQDPRTPGFQMPLNPLADVPGYTTITDLSNTIIRENSARNGAKSNASRGKMGNLGDMSWHDWQRRNPSI